MVLKDFSFQKNTSVFFLSIKTFFYILSETLEQIACKSPSNFSPVKKFSAVGVSGKV